MLTEKKNTLYAYPSLLPLRMALIAAVSEAPTRAPRMDANEQRAMQLIEKVKAKYKKQKFVLTWNDIPSPYGFHENYQEMTVMRAG